MSSAKVPPRFVPTLTDVVPGNTEAEAASGLRANPQAVVADDGSKESSSWVREGMLAPRRGVVSLPVSLPPLPQDLAPQPSLLDELTQAPPGVSEPQEPMFASGVLTTHAEAEPGTAEVPMPQPVRETAPVPAEPAPAPSEAVAPVSAASAPPSVADAMDGLWEVHAQKITEEYLVHRLMQRVDLVLDERLREAIAVVVQEQTRSIVVRLREEVESVVRQAVYEAVADELAQQARTVRDKGAYTP